MYRRVVVGCLMLALPWAGRAGHAQRPDRAAPVITPLLHSSVQLEYDGKVIQIDPWSQADLSRAKPADLILITDDPIHHLDPKAIALLRKPGAPVVVPSVSRSKFPDGVPMANGESQTFAGVGVEAIAAYDIIPGEPSHPKGKSNGYVVTLGATRIYVAGVTECVPEVRALRNIDVAFIPMNIPLDRMTPTAAAACANAIKPRAVYVYHYDQSFGGGRGLSPDNAATINAFRAALDGGIEFRSAVWYPPAPASTPPRPIVGAPIVPLEDSYLQWPLPPSASMYGRIDGARLKPYVNDLAAISRKSRDAGNQWWGRITGTPAHEEAQQYVAAKLRGFGLDVRFEAHTLPPTWFPKSWEVSAASGGHTIALKTAHPVLRSSGTPAGGLDLEAVYVGLGTPADFAGRDVRGKAVFIYSNPTPSALNHSARTDGAMKLAEDAGAAAIVIVLGIPGNFTTQLWGSGGEGPDQTKVPWFSVGLEDGTAARQLIEQGRPVRVTMRLDVELRSNLKPSALFATLPGATDENILVIAHTDGFWEASVDNASGVASMLGLAEYFSKIPRADRRRTITFMCPIGHHVTPDISLQELHDKRSTYFAKTALIINAEHVTTTQTYLFGSMLRKSNAATAHRFYVGRSKRLAQILVEDFRLFGVALYELPSTRFGVAGDLVKFTEDAPGIEVIESNAFYHSNFDTPDVVPAAGLESITRAYAKIVDDINKLSLEEIVDPIER